MEFICFVCPAFISLLIYLKHFDKEKDIIKTISYFFISALVVNAISLFVVYFVFNHNEITFTIQFTLKYLLMASITAAFTPLLIKKFLEFTEDIKKMINSGMDKDGHFHIKRMYKNNKKKINNYIFIITTLLIFYITDLSIRSLSIKISAFSYLFNKPVFLITLSYCMAFLFIEYFLQKKLSKIIAIVFYLINTILFVANYMLLQIKGEALSIYELNNAAEGAQFLNFLLDKLTPYFIFIIVLMIIIYIIHFKSLSNINKLGKKKFKFKYLLGIIIVVYVLFSWGISSLETSSDDWEIISKPRYYYNNTINPKKSLSVLGMYEFHCRDLHLYLKNSYTKYGSKKEIEKTISKYKRTKEENEYTGVFKDKNVIMIMLESIDYSIIDEKTMPTLSKMMNDGWTFPKRYSALATGGSTLQTEYTSVSGLFYEERYYNEINANNYYMSLPNMFNREGYKTNSIHENNGVFYNREKLHKALGFENSYFLYDILEKPKIYNDAQIAKNEDIYKKIVSKDDKFMDLVITIAAHGPYDYNNNLCHKLGDDYTQEECFRYLSKRTDNLLKELLKKLKRDGLLDDTVIILYTDHQAYAYDYPKEYLDSLTKVDSNGSIKAIPLIIYNPSIGHKEFNNLLVNDIDLVPTILNLFDIDYNPNYYLGDDLFSDNHKNLVMFKDYSWYDGNTYSANKNVNKSTVSYKNNTTYTMDKIDLGKMMLSNNYYKQIEKEETKKSNKK